MNFHKERWNWQNNTVVQVILEFHLENIINHRQCLAEELRNEFSQKMEVQCKQNIIYSEAHIDFADFLGTSKYLHFAFLAKTTQG